MYPIGRGWDTIFHMFLLFLKMERRDVLGWDMIIITLKGQSFLLNQIRKMVGLAIEIIRGTAPEWAIEDALEKSNKRILHMAPGEGLLLDRVSLIPMFVILTNIRCSSIWFVSATCNFRFFMTRII